MTLAGPPVSAADLDAAIEIATAAGAVTHRWFGHRDIGLEHKRDGTPVTRADTEAERLVRDLLAQRFPDDTVVGEEHDDTTGTSGRRWIVDPIDGTKAFSRGVPLYSTLLALEDEHGPAVGVIGLPALGQVVAAGRGLGCTVDGDPVQVSTRDSLDGAYVMTSSVKGWPPGAYDRLTGAGAVVRTWGDGYGYAMVATGRAEAMVDVAANAWDVAPVPVILAEAGGRFTDLAGADRIDGGDGLGTNGHVHDAVRAAFGR